MNESTEQSHKVCDCNQGRLPCTCKPEPILILSTEEFDQFKSDIENRPLANNLSAQRLLRRSKRWS